MALDVATGYWYAVLMRNERFEWDDAKAASNEAKHGVTFDEARMVFDDPLAVEETDDAHDELRSVTIGMGSKGRLLVVVSTEREGRTRIISAREAERPERRRYEHGT